ncbi:hypothetical protein BDR22DRAFT_822258 [Usnea florida]
MASLLKVFPPELLLQVIKAQHDIADVLALTSTCRILRHLWLSDFRTITDSILSKRIRCYDDAVALAEAQRKWEPKSQQSDTWTVASARTECDKICYQDFRPRLRHLLANNVESERVSFFAGLYFIPSERCGGRNNCSVHPARFLPHEHERVARSFYFIRLCVLAQSHTSMQSKCQHDLDRMGVTELYILWEMLQWLCDHWIGTPGIFPCSDLDQVCDMITDAYCAKRSLGEDWYENRLHGPCDRCNKETCGSDLPVRRFSDP